MKQSCLLRQSWGHPKQGHQNVKPPQDPLTGLSPKLSQVGLSHSFPTAAADAMGLRSYLHPFHNTSSIQKKASVPIVDPAGCHGYR